MLYTLFPKLYTVWGEKGLFSLYLQQKSGCGNLKKENVCEHLTAVLTTGTVNIETIAVCVSLLPSIAPTPS